jgi:hypothetical protein
MSCPSQSNALYLLRSEQKNFAKSLERISREARATGAFADVHAFTDKDISHEYAEAHSEILQQPRGAGYWLWKPYFVSRVLSGLADGDILFYADAGCEFRASPEPYLQLAFQHGFLAFRLDSKHALQIWTKGDIIAAVGLNDASYERFTLLKIKNYINPDDKVLYIHTKGITRYHTHLYSNINDWVNLMDYFLIYNYSICLNVLETFETVGINYHPHVTNNSPHYSGNYWWCTAKYFLSLNDYIPDDYYAPEFYLFSQRPRYLCLFYSNVDQYNVRFPFLNYV